MRIAFIWMAVILIAGIALTGCATLEGVIDGGLYTSPDGEFSVQVPDIPDMGGRDGFAGAHKTYVDFYMGAGYWMAWGSYSVEWYKLKASLTSKEAYYQRTLKFVPSWVAHEFGPTHSFRISAAKKLQINGRPAYQIIATGTADGIPAVLVGTFIDFSCRVAVGYSVFSLEGSAPKNEVKQPKDAIQWQKYDRFVESIRKNAPAC